MFLVKALYDCNPDRNDELGFKEGDKLVITAKLNDDWWVSSNENGLMDGWVDG